MDVLREIRIAIEDALGCLTVPVSGSWFALVDVADYEMASKYKWYRTTGGYARSNAPGQRGSSVWLHRLIANPPTGKEVDHVNRLTWDNRRINLRVCEPVKNRFNLPLRSDNTTGFKGVYRRRNKWRAQVSAGRKHHYLGCFDTPEEAARAYDLKALELFGEFACLNFPAVDNGN